MKKLVILFAAAVMMLPLAISCKKVDQPTTDVVMEPAATADVAKVVSFENLPMAQRPTYVTAGSTYEIVSVEFTEGSRYIMRRRPVLLRLPQCCFCSVVVFIALCFIVVTILNVE